MPSKINLLNQQIGDLIIIKETDKRKNNSIVWQCQCKCGNIEEFSTKELRSGGIIQCSKCGNKRLPQTNLRENIIGKKFNHLTVIEKTERRCSDGKIIYKCICDCEKQTEIFTSSTDLKNNHVTSCGCAKRKYAIGNIVNNREIIGYEGSKNNNGRYYYKCRCLFCGREYASLGQNLERTISCGCRKSIGEYNIFQVLKTNNIPYIKEYKFLNSSLRFDFAILNNLNKTIRLIEFDGEQHYKENIKNNGWNTYQKYQYTLNNDLLKNQLAQENNIPLVRIPYWERNNISLELIMSDKYLVKEESYEKS